MAEDTILLGRGPDTFALYFPNQDPYKAFYNRFSLTQAFIDKPHNMYLQLLFNLGGVAVLAFLAMVVLHAIHTFRILKSAKPLGDRYMLALGLFVGWFAYLLAAVFYDSSVSVAPAFWIVFGLSMAINEILKRETHDKHGREALGQVGCRNVR
jgi:O-antigen ligase